jgi:hypothetical protein
MQALGGLDNNKVLIPLFTVEVPIARIRPHDVVVVVAAGGCLLHFFFGFNLNHGGSLRLFLFPHSPQHTILRGSSRTIWRGKKSITRISTTTSAPFNYH